MKLLVVSFLFMFFGSAHASVYSFETIAAHDGFSLIPYGINDAGHIVGAAEPTGFSAGGVRARSGFLLKHGKFSLLNYPGFSLDNPDYYLIAFGINVKDEIVGEIGYSPAPPYAFLFSQGNYSRITYPNFFIFSSHGINASGTICGMNGRTPGSSFLLKNNVATTLAVPGGSATQCRGINDAGNVVGFYTGSDNKTHGFYYQNGDYKTIDYPGAIATSLYGINLVGDIVGTFTEVTASQDVVQHGFILSGGAFTKIDVPDAIGTNAFGINAERKIVGRYIDKTGTHGFIATPIHGPSKNIMKSPFRRP